MIDEHLAFEKWHKMPMIIYRIAYASRKHILQYLKNCVFTKIDERLQLALVATVVLQHIEQKSVLRVADLLLAPLFQPTLLDLEVNLLHLFRGSDNECD